MQPFFEMTVLPDMKLVVMRYSLLVNGKTELSSLRSQLE